MKTPPRTIRLAICLSAVGTLACLGLLARENPYTFSIFMFIGQPCLLVSALLFAWQVLKDLRDRGVLS